MPTVGNEPDDALGGSFVPGMRRSRTYIGTASLAGRVADRLAAFVQIAIVAATLGAFPEADVFFLAAIAPLTIGVIVGEPLGRGMLTLLLEADGPKRARAVAAAGFWVAAGVLAAVTVVYVLAAFVLVKVFTPGNMSAFTPWLAFAPIAPALGLSNFLGGLLLFRERYVWDAMRLGLGSVVAVPLLWLATHETIGITWPAAALTAGYVVAAAAVLIVVTRDFGLRWPGAADRPAFGAIVRARRMLASPIAGGLVGNPVIVMIERVLVATIGPGSVSTIAYARGIASAPSMLSQAVGSATYPGMVRAGLAEDAEGESYLRSSFLSGLRLALILGGGSAIFFAVFAHSTTSLLLQRGALGATSVERTSNALAAFALSTLATSVLMYVVPVLYGVGRFSGVLQRSLVVFVAYMVLAPALLLFSGETGVAIAFSLAQSVGALFAVGVVVRRLAIPARGLWTEVVLPIGWRMGLLGGVLLAYRAAIEATSVSGRSLDALLAVGGAALLAVAVPVLVLSARTPEAEHLRKLVRLRRASPAPPPAPGTARPGP